VLQYLKNEVPYASNTGIPANNSERKVKIAWELKK
jgi:hypothetical protein